METTALAEPNFSSIMTQTTKTAVFNKTEYYFEIVVLLIGIIGTLANGFVCYLLVIISRKKNSGNSSYLILNQALLDCFSCLFLTVTYATKIYMLGRTWDHWVCVFIGSEMILWVGLDGSAINLAIITIERYVKIVHPVLHRRYAKDWMISVAIVFSWVNGIVLTVPGIWTTSGVQDGDCLIGAFFPSISLQVFNAIFYVVWEYFVPLLIFIVCYGKIFLSARKRLKVNPSVATPDTIKTSATGTAVSKNCEKGTGNPSQLLSQEKANRTQMNIFKTMIIICVAFCVCWTPNQMYFLITNLPMFQDQLDIGGNVWYGTISLAFLNLIVNPLIYAASLESVKNQLKSCRMRIKKLNHGPLPSTISQQSELP